MFNPFNRLVVTKADPDILIISSSRLYHALQALSMMVLTLIFASILCFQYRGVCPDLDSLQPRLPPDSLRTGCTLAVLLMGLGIFLYVIAGSLKLVIAPVRFTFDRVQDTVTRNGERPAWVRDISGVSIVARGRGRSRSYDLEVELRSGDPMVIERGCDRVEAVSVGEQIAGFVGVELARESETRLA